MAQHAIQSLQTQHLNKSTLKRAGIVTILIDYLLPPSSLPCATSLANDPEEVKACLRLISHGDHTPRRESKSSQRIEKGTVDNLLRNP